MRLVLARNHRNQQRFKVTLRVFEAAGPPDVRPKGIDGCVVEPRAMVRQPLYFLLVIKFVEADGHA